METHKFNKRVIAISCVLLGTMIMGILMWYCNPIENDTTLKVYNSNGESMVIQANLYISRMPFSIATIEGEIYLADRSYKSWVYSDYTDSSYKNILNKNKDEVITPIFANSSNFEKGIDFLLSDLLIVQSIQFDKNYNILEITFMLTSDGSGIWSSSLK